MSERENGDDRNAMANERTDMAEDRTLMANERTFAGWTRTAFASLGIGLGFQALFREVEPTWVAKSIATLFILLAIYIIWIAERRASSVLKRMNAHQVEVLKGVNFCVMATVATIGGGLLAAALWWLM